MADLCLERFGVPHIVINNAGVAYGGLIWEAGPRDWEWVLGVNLWGVIHGVRIFTPLMLAEARKNPAYQGHIVNVASMAGLKVLGKIGVYAMSKAAVVHMTKAFAVEWGKFGINVNAICPGYIDTEINHHHWQTEQGQKLISMLPRKRVGQPQDLDALLVMLASDQSHFINGAVISAVDGFAV